jgi:beta-N-acetylglucosaminidase
MNKYFLDKLRIVLLIVIICSLILIIPNTVMAAVSPKQMEHKINVPVDKVWQIKFSRAINMDNPSKSVIVYNPRALPAPVSISYNHNTITVKPPTSGYIPGQTYSLQIYENITDLNSNPLKAAVTMSFTIAVPDNIPLENTRNKKYIYNEYDITLDEIVDKQSKVSPVNVVKNYYLTPSKLDIYQYMNPKNFENHDYAIYQFLKLNYIEGITAKELDSILLGKGFLAGQGKIILDACKEYDVNPAYIVAHTILETGNGTSKLSNGSIIVSEVKGVPVLASKPIYNMFGIGARDINPLVLGSERAYIEGWFTPEAAIVGGIKFISTQYINNSIHKQNTLYKMRWNPKSPATHQYATDIAWAYKQSYRIKEILNDCLNANLIFEIPQYK